MTAIESVFVDLSRVSVCKNLNLRFNKIRRQQHNMRVSLSV